MNISFFVVQSYLLYLTRFYHFIVHVAIVVHLLNRRLLLICHLPIVLHLLKNYFYSDWREGDRSSVRKIRLLRGGESSAEDFWMSYSQINRSYPLCFYLWTNDVNRVFLICRILVFKLYFIIFFTNNILSRYCHFGLRLSYYLNRTIVAIYCGNGLFLFSLNRISIAVIFPRRNETPKRATPFGFADHNSQVHNAVYAYLLPEKMCDGECGGKSFHWCARKPVGRRLDREIRPLSAGEGVGRHTKGIVLRAGPAQMYHVLSVFH